MGKLLIIPDINNIEKSLELASEYNLGFEYNDFFDPDVLDDQKEVDRLIDNYKQYELPGFSTLHGAFFDVIPFSKDKRIREVSMLRIKQSIDVARRLGVAAVVFHTNYNPFLNSDGYKKIWVEENVTLWSDILEANRDLDIYLENMFDTSPEMLKMLSERLSVYSNFGICFDYGHAAISQVEPAEWISSLGKYVKHIHINDNDLVSDLHLSWGAGKIDREAFYDGYKKYMSEATILIENSSLENQIKSLNKLREEGFINS